jgi:hypothetical protein
VWDFDDAKATIFLRTDWVCPEHRSCRFVNIVTVSSSTNEGLAEAVTLTVMKDAHEMPDFMSL